MNRKVGTSCQLEEAISFKWWEDHIHQEEEAPKRFSIGGMKDAKKFHRVSLQWFILLAHFAL